MEVPDGEVDEVETATDFVPTAAAIALNTSYDWRPVGAEATS